MSETKTVSTVSTEQSTALNLFHRAQLFIGGKWVEPAGEDRIEIMDPTSGQVIGSVPEANEKDADRAIVCAVNAFKNSPWRKLTFIERAEWLEILADEIERRSNQIAEVHVRAFGLLAGPAANVGPRNARVLRAHYQFAEELTATPVERHIGGVDAIVTREPVGPVLAIVPWNTTFGISILNLASALLAGCPIVIKLAVESPLQAFIIADAMEAVDFPTGLVSFLPARRERLGHITQRPEFRHIVFTGSTPAGTQVMQDAALNIAAVTLELGGKSPAIILDDVDPLQDVNLLYPGTMGQSGQACTLYSRLLVPRSREAEWRDSLTRWFDGLIVGDPADSATQVGPLVTAAHQASVERYIEIARAEGATILAGGRPSELPGNFVQPTLVADVTQDMRIVREEVFGPVITLQSYATLEEAVELANDSDYGLAAGIFTNDMGRAIDIAGLLEAGNISVNLSDACTLMPFGGFKKSGIGREGGVEGVEEFLEWKQLQLRRSSTISSERFRSTTTVPLS